MTEPPRRALEPGNTVTLLPTEWSGSETLHVQLTAVHRAADGIYLYGVDQHGCSYERLRVPNAAEYGIELRWLAQTTRALDR